MYVLLDITTVLTYVLMYLIQPSTEFQLKFPNI